MTELATGLDTQHPLFSHNAALFLLLGKAQKYTAENYCTQDRKAIMLGRRHKMRRRRRLFFSQVLAETQDDFIALSFENVHRDSVHIRHATATRRHADGKT